MGGKSKAVTVSFWYKLIALFGWCKGPIDALLEIRGGDRTAWQGRQETSGIIDIDAAELYGGESAEGGIQGQFEVMMGEPDQAPNAYMIEHFGPEQPGRRGKAMGLFRGGRIGAGNPYPKPLYFKLERIFKGWEDDVCWYPEKARVGGAGQAGIGAGSWWLTGVGSGNLWIGNDPADFSEAVEVIRSPSAGIGTHGVHGGGYYRVNDQMAILVDTGTGQYELVYDGLAITGTVAPQVGALPGLAGAGTPCDVRVIDGAVFLIMASTGRVDYYAWDSAGYAGGPLNWVTRTAPGGLRMGDLVRVGNNFVCFVRQSSEEAFYTQPVANSIPNDGDWVLADSGNPLAPSIGDKFLPLSGDECIVVRGGTNPILKTTDAGRNWYEDVTPFPGDPNYLSNCAATARSPNGVILVSDTNATRLGISRDDGTTWEYAPGVTWGATRVEFYDNKFVASAPGEGGGIFVFDANGENMVQAVLPGGVEPGFYTSLYMCPVNTINANTLTGYMNPAHIIYDAITSRRENGGMGEPIALINDASFRAAADYFYDQGVGLCCTWYGGESAEQFIQRICTVAGCTWSQSTVDGMHYLYPMREVEDPSTLPRVTDDDIIEFQAEPALPSESINQVQVKWFDPETREERITPPVQALGAIEDAGGVLADVREYFEIPYEELALRTAQRDLNTFSSALWRFSLVVVARLAGLQKGQQVLIEAPNRGFAYMIAMVVDVDEGTLGESEVSLALLQDVFALPSAAFVSAQPSLAPPTVTTPTNVDDMVVIETPYLELVAAMRPADLQAVSPESGYLMVGAEQPGNGTQYALWTKAGSEEYDEYGNADWTPTATIVEAAPLGPGEPATDFTFENGTLLERVELGTWVLWGSEMCRLDALDIDAGTISLARAVGDTVPHSHAAGEKVYFIGDWYGTDAREYLDAEVVTAKAQNRTGQGVVPFASAAAETVTMDSRQARPYPPARVTINGTYYPDSGEGDVTLEWAHRDRVQQADQLLPWVEPSVGPEEGAVYNARLYKDNVLVSAETLINGDTWTFTDPGAGVVRVELETEVGGLVSWQVFVHEMPWGSDTLTTEAGDNLTTEAGDRLTLE